MDAMQYQAEAGRTLNNAPYQMALANYVLGVLGEVYELAAVREAWFGAKGREDLLETMARVEDETGDVWWYIAATCSTLGVSLRDVVEAGGLALSRKKSQLYTGVPTAVGALAEMAKKESFHGRPAMRENWVAVLADVAAWLLLVDGAEKLERVWAQNIAKLRVRYPDGFVVGGAKATPTVL